MRKIKCSILLLMALLLSGCGESQSVITAKYLPGDKVLMTIDDSQGLILKKLDGFSNPGYKIKYLTGKYAGTEEYCWQWELKSLGE